MARAESPIFANNDSQRDSSGTRTERILSTKCSVEFDGENEGVDGELVELSKLQARENDE